jgi:polar amino acid transport system substrate-binding protein
MAEVAERRAFFKAGGVGLLAATAAGLSSCAPRSPGAQGKSLLQTVLERKRLIVGTGSTNPPWHFEDEKGQLTGMDVAMARILAKGLFDDPGQVEFVLQNPIARIPNLTTGKVDIVIQFMTVSPGRAQLVAFTRPYYIEGAALLTTRSAQWLKHDELRSAGSRVRAAVLQNVDADGLVRNALPEAQVMQLDSQANVIQALQAGRADVAIVDNSAMKWLTKRYPGMYSDPGYLAPRAQLYSAAVRHGEFEWLHWVNTCLDVAIHGHQPEIFDSAFEQFLGEKPPRRHLGFPSF